MAVHATAFIKIYIGVNYWITWIKKQNSRVMAGNCGCSSTFVPASIVNFLLE